MRYFLFSIVLILAACGPKKDGPASNDLPGLKVQLAEKQKQMDALKQEITVIQEKIAKLDTSKVYKKMLVSLDTLQYQNFKHTIDIQGTVTGDELLNISPKVPAMYTRIYVVKGQSVSKGQLLATLDNSVINEGMEELKSSIEYAKTIYEKQKHLWDQKIGSEVQYLNAKNNLESLNKKMATMRQQNAMYRLVSPINGQVDDVMAKEGEMGSPGAPSIRVLNLRTLKFVANAAESYVDKIKTGNSVEVFFPDLNKSFNTKVTTIGKMINNLNRTFTVDIALPHSPDIRPNMMAVSKIKDYSNPKALVVPINILVNVDTDPYLYVAEEKAGTLRAVKRKVKLGNTNSNEVEILSGLKPGDKVITIGYQDLNDGDPITITN